MECSAIRVSARFAIIGIEDGGLYHTTERYEYTAVPMGNAAVPEAETVSGHTDLAVTMISSLMPDMVYQMSIWSRSQAPVTLTVHTEKESVTLNVRSFGARGDGISDDTLAIQTAICVCPRDGRVLVPAGCYQVTSLFLKSHVRLEIAENAQLCGTKDADRLPVLPGRTESYDEKSEYLLGSFEGNPISQYASMLTAVSVEDCIVYGRGTLNGNADFTDWWDMRRWKTDFTAARPNMIFWSHSRDMLLAGLKVTNSPMWTLHPYYSSRVDIMAVTVENPWNSHNTDGLDPESCDGMNILGVRFSLGDDCIAIKSGKIYMGRKYKKPSENILIAHCLMERGHGAVTIGSENAGGVRQIRVEKCLFRDTDRGLRIKSRRGRGKDSVLKDISFAQIRMEHVLTPFVLNCFYFCDPDGKTDYVQSRDKLPVDDRTPQIGSMQFSDIECIDTEYAAAYFLGLPEKPAGRITMEHVHVSYKEDAGSGIPVMACGISEVSRLGIHAENVEQLVLKDVTLDGCEGEAVTAVNTAVVQER